MYEVVSMLSTMHTNAQTTDTGKARPQKKRGAEDLPPSHVPKQLCIIYYNYGMGSGKLSTMRTLTG